MMMNMTGDNVEDGRTDDDEYDCGVNAEGVADSHGYAHHILCVYGALKKIFVTREVMI